MLYDASIASSKAMLPNADRKLLCIKTPLHIRVCRLDKSDKSRRIDIAIRPELYVAHVLAGTFQQARRIREFGAMEKSDIDMRFERVDIGEGGISDARSWVAVMQQFVYIISTIADNVEPKSCDSAQFTGMLAHPGIDCRISPNRTGEPKDLIHSNYGQNWRPKIELPEVATSNAA
jgi:hypothetical protein